MSVSSRSNTSVFRVWSGVGFAGDEARVVKTWVVRLIVGVTQDGENVGERVEVGEATSGTGALSPRRLNSSSSGVSGGMRLKVGGREAAG